MHFYIGIPRRLNRLNKLVDETRKFISNYIYYRRHKHNHARAWNMARNTL